MSEPVGHIALRERLRLPVAAPAVESYIVAGARRTEIRGDRTFEYYPRRYAPDGSLVSHLRFALRHEPTDLGVLVAALKAIDPAELAAWVRHDLREELDFVAVYDRALAAVRDVVDMPDRRASLFVQLCLQNDGRLSRTKRDTFRELTDAEVAQLETAVQSAIQGEPERTV